MIKGLIWLERGNRRNIIVAVLIFLLIVAGAYLIGIFKKTCFDNACFEQALTECSPADFIKVRNHNVYLYSITQSYFEECNVVIELKKIAPGTEPEFKERLEGKSMKCSIPKTVLQETSIDDLNQILKYCHGQLKEGILEIIIEKMYAQIIINLDSIVEQSRSFLREI